ncbi:zinc finger protein [Aphelenchoides avenae]|nr:zinc finger protein [Aphelenchus avenae]
MLAASVSPPSASPLLPVSRALSHDDSLPDLPVLVKEESVSDCQPSCSLTALDNAKADVRPDKESKRKREDQAPLCCDICGQDTNTYHYDVASCNGCRTFFRRTIMLGKAYTCMSGGRCPQQLYRNCRACRFDRCILIGMSLDAVKFPPHVDAELVNRAIMHRRKELISGAHDTPFKFSLLCHGSLECHEINELLHAEGKCLTLREAVEPSAMYTANLRSNLLEDVRLGNIGRLQQKPPPGREVKVEYILNGHVYEQKAVGSGRNWLGIDLVFGVEVAKTLPVFQRLELADKMALLAQTSFANMTFLMAFYSVSQHSSTMTFPCGNPPMPMCVRVETQSIPLACFSQTGLETEVYCRSVVPMLRTGLSVEEYVLLRAIIFCNAESRDLTSEGREIVLCERERYADLLLRHLQLKHGRSGGAARYSEVIALVNTYVHFGQRYWEHINLMGLIMNANGNIRIRGHFGLINDLMYGPRPDG